MAELVLTPEETAAALGVTLKVLSQMRVAGNGPAYFKLARGKSGRVRYMRAAVERHLEIARNDELLLMTREEAAAALGVTTQLLDRRRSDANFPKCIEIGHGKHARIRYRRADVERYVSATSLVLSRDL
jgi:predicted DNA-binding transcriptional regulator AlpA